VWFKASMHHLYVQAKKDHSRQELPINYQLTLEEVYTIINDWDDDWKNPYDQPGSSQEHEDQGQSKEEEASVQTNGTYKQQGKMKFPKVGLKRKDQELEQTGGTPKKTGGSRKKAKAQCQTPFYILSDDDMDRIGLFIPDSTREIWEEATTKHEDHQKKV
jgi:hypothetical protein